MDLNDPLNELFSQGKTCHSLRQRGKGTKNYTWRSEQAGVFSVQNRHQKAKCSNKHINEWKQTLKQHSKKKTALKVVPFSMNTTPWNACFHVIAITINIKPVNIHKMSVHDQNTQAKAFGVNTLCTLLPSTELIIYVCRVQTAAGLLHPKILSAIYYLSGQSSIYYLQEHCCVSSRDYFYSWYYTHL